MKIHHDQNVVQHDGAEQAEQQTGKSVIHGADLANEEYAGALGNLTRSFRDDAPDVSCYRAQIAVLGRRIDLHHGLDIVLGEYGIAGAAADIRQSAQYLRGAAGCAADRQIGQSRK